MAGFGFDEKTGTAVPGLKAGITENVYVSKITVGEYKNDTTYIEFQFVTEDGKKSTIRENEFDPEKIKNEKTRDMIMDAFKQRMKHIALCFLPEEKAKVKAKSTFKKFANSFVKLIGENYKDKEIAVKFVYNKDGYLSFPLFPGSGFMVPQEDASHLEINSNDEKRLVKPKPDEEKDKKSGKDEDAFNKIEKQQEQQRAESDDEDMEEDSVASAEEDFEEDL